MWKSCGLNRRCGTCARPTAAAATAAAGPVRPAAARWRRSPPGRGSLPSGGAAPVHRRDGGRFRCGGHDGHRTAAKGALPRLCGPGAGGISQLPAYVLRGVQRLPRLHLPRCALPLPPPGHPFHGGLRPGGQPGVPKTLACPTTTVPGPSPTPPVCWWTKGVASPGSSP